MQRQQYEEICSSIASGEKEFVENRQLFYTGEVIACRHDMLEVEAFGHKAVWPSYQCEPTDGRKNPLGPPSNV